MIQLNKQNSAILIADMAFVDSLPRKKYISRLLFIKNGTTTRIVSNPEYVPSGLTKSEKRIKRWEYENRRREFIIDYLKEKHPNTDYAEEYSKFNEWDIPLRFHTDESLKCEYLNEDKHHCDKKRNKTSCYTCCFECFSPKSSIGCEVECELIK